MGTRRFGACGIYGGERTQGVPGWKAYNDLNIATLYGITETLQVGDTNIQTQTVARDTRTAAE